MRVVTSTDGDIAVLELEGNLTIGTPDTVFSTAVERLLESGKTVIVLDMKGVDFIDSTGLGSLVRSHHLCSQGGGEVRLADVSFQVWDLLEAARLSKVIPVFENRRQAVAGIADS